MGMENAISSLSPRLQLLAALVPEGCTVADIGADHAWLSIALAERSRNVIASEYGDGPYNRLVGQLQRYAEGMRIESRQGDGLQVLRPSEAGVVIIAGLGGDTIVNILDSCRDLAESMGFYLLQPMSRSRSLREWLCKWGWRLGPEHLVWEERRPYVVIEARPDGGVCPALSDLELELGANLLDLKNHEYLFYHYERWKRVLQGLQIANGPEDRKLGSLYAERIGRLEMILNGSNPA